MIFQLEFTPEIRKELNYQRYNHPSPLVQRRMETIWLKAHKLQHGQIAELAGVSENTLRDYWELYQTGGVDKLKELNFYRPVGALNQPISCLETHFQNNPPASIKEAQQEIEEITGVRRSETQGAEFLKKKLHLRYRKVGTIPAKADPDEQARDLKEVLEPRLEEAKDGKRAVFFVDATHFVLAAFLGFLWSVKRIFIQSPSGRQRFNGLGALNAITHEMITVTNDAYLNAESVGLLLEKLAALNLGMPITLFLDTARYPKCALVIEKAISLQIEVCFLPSYSPNLNLIERVGKFVKKKCLYSQYYEKFPAFKTAISNCLAEMPTTYKAELSALLTLPFQTFQKTQFVTV